MITRSRIRESKFGICKTCILNSDSHELQISETEKENEFKGRVPLKSSSFISSDNEHFQDSCAEVHIRLPPDLNDLKLNVTDIQQILNSRVWLFNNSPMKVVKNLQDGNGALLVVLREVKLTPENNLEKFDLKKAEDLSASQSSSTDASEDTERLCSESNEHGSRNNISKGCGCNKISDKMRSYRSRKAIRNYPFDGNNIKLKKAIVVLTDIAKSKDYKEIVNAYLAQKVPKEKQDVSSPRQQGCLTSNNQTADKKSPNLKHSLSGVKASVESFNGTPLGSSRILTRLAEGCNFSEILNRFRLQHGCSAVETTECSDTTSQTDYSAIGENHQDELQQSESCNQNYFESCENPVTVKIEAFESEEHKFYPPLNREFESEIVGPLGSSESDERVGVTGNVSDVVVKTEERCCMSETFGDHLNNSSNSINFEELDLETQLEIMKKKNALNTGKSKNGKKKSKAKSLPQGLSPKSKEKMKSSNKKSPNKKAKPLTADYIPLDTSGPTKFGVAMLNQIQPYGQHDAKDFKNRMLFGDRVRRFPTQNHLRTYKLKQQAASCKRE